MEYNLIGETPNVGGEQPKLSLLNQAIVDAGITLEIGSTYIKYKEQQIPLFPKINKYEEYSLIYKHNQKTICTLAFIDQSTVSIK